MARARRDWQTQRAELRRLLRETTAANSYWDDTDLLDYYNQAIDLRTIDLAQANEGWVTDPVQTDIIANQAEYLLPEGTGRVKRVLRVFNPGTNNEVKVPLTRFERWSYPTPKYSGIGDSRHTPTYRLVGDLLYLEPPPTTSETNGLLLEIDVAPARISLDTDKLDQRFPDIMETLLIYDAWDLALGVELSMGSDVNQATIDRLSRFHQKYEARFLDYIETRSFGRVFSLPYSLGD